MNPKTVWIDDEHLKKMTKEWIKEMPEDPLDPEGPDLENIVEEFLMSIIRDHSSAGVVQR